MSCTTRDGGNGRRIRRGLGLVELLVSLAIAASLLTAIAVAYAATTDAIRVNDEFFRASQAARVSINHIMAEVRKCTGGIVDSEVMELTTASGERRTYSFDRGNHVLTLTLPDHVDSPTYALARNVDNVEFFTDERTMSMTVTIEVGRNKVTLSGSAMPRRTITFN